MLLSPSRYAVSTDPQRPLSSRPRYYLACTLSTIRLLCHFPNTRSAPIGPFPCLAGLHLTQCARTQLPAPCRQPKKTIRP
ncbi:unnamed protein product [Protopolystoma xenopodis]|uniref:Uncharacterized protein n=1 Tax=Protopolystoma xenopodis TaxID=117903 RepID=A0A448XMW2_9PLAT|nr:unnamed protein product [Protopolystoma xenopodis]